MVKKKHGGSRIGAGRKPTADGPTIVVGASVPSALMDRLDSIADKKGWNRSTAITEAVRLLIKRHEPKIP